VFRHHEFIIKLALEYFERNTQIALLEMRFHFLHIMLKISFFVTHSNV